MLNDSLWSSNANWVFSWKQWASSWCEAYRFCGCKIRPDIDPNRAEFRRETFESGIPRRRLLLVCSLCQQQVCCWYYRCQSTRLTCTTRWTCTRWRSKRRSTSALTRETEPPSSTASRAACTTVSRLIRYQLIPALSFSLYTVHVDPTETGRRLHCQVCISDVEQI